MSLSQLVQRYCPFEMPLLRHREDRIPVMIFFMFFASDFAVYLLARNWWVPVLWFLVGMIPKGWICSWNHNHQHVHMFRSPFLNRVLELGFALQTGVMTNAWLLHHVLGHHLHYLDPIADESGWMNPNGRPMGLWEYTVKNTLTAYPRVWRVGGKYPHHRRVFFWGSVVFFLVLGALLEHNLYNGLWVYLFPIIVSFMGTIWVTWFHHANLPTDDPMLASNNTVDPMYNLFTGNLGYHTAHHHRQALHWSKLPQLHAELADRIPASTYREVGFPFNLLARAFTPQAPPNRVRATVSASESPRA